MEAIVQDRQRHHPMAHRVIAPEAPQAKVARRAIVPDVAHLLRAAAAMVVEAVIVAALHPRPPAIEVAAAQARAQAAAATAAVLAQAVVASVADLVQAAVAATEVAAVVADAIKTPLI